MDDVGATNFEAVCKSDAKLSHAGIANNGRGEWGPVVYCPENAPAVCGIKTRIDGLIDILIKDEKSGREKNLGRNRNSIFQKSEEKRKNDDPYYCGFR